MILGIVGSPRKGKVTDQLITKCLEGVEKAGSEAKKVYLIDYPLQCWTENTELPEKLDQLWMEAEGYIIGAPVYYGSINGLAKDFMDIAKITDVNGKYGLGIAIAGGSGRGLCSGIQTIYRFFYHRKIRAVYPTPVSRFNLQKILSTINDTGRRVAELSTKKKSFEGDQDRMEYYENLQYLNYTYLDEILLLADQLIEISKDNPDLSKAKQEYDTAISLIRQGKRKDAIKNAVNAYNILYFDPPKD
ncbi:flavodoxin family protein [[Eubacterium] cellulosolvens]